MCGESIPAIAPDGPHEPLVDCGGTWLEIAKKIEISLTAVLKVRKEWLSTIRPWLFLTPLLPMAMLGKEASSTTSAAIICHVCCPKSTATQSRDCGQKS